MPITLSTRPAWFVPRAGLFLARKYKTAHQNIVWVSRLLQERSFVPVRAVTQERISAYIYLHLSTFIYIDKCIAIDYDTILSRTPLAKAAPGKVATSL